MKNCFRSISLVVVSLLFISMSGCSSQAFNAEPAKVNSIKSVAVVSFTVPAFVVEEEEGMLSGFTAVVDLVSDLVSDEENLGNGQQVANEAVAGFIEGMSAAGRWDILPASAVSSNADIKSMMASSEKIHNMISMDGTPAVELGIDGESSEYAAKAAKALGVDGVMMLVAYDMSYFLYTGAAGTGQAKAKASGVFKLYDRQGNSVWESGAVVWTEDSAAMVAGAINPLESAKLHKSVGRDLATDVLKRYKDNAG